MEEVILVLQFSQNILKLSVLKIQVLEIYIVTIDIGLFFLYRKKAEKIRTNVFIKEKNVVLPKIIKLVNTYDHYFS